MAKLKINNRWYDVDEADISYCFDQYDQEYVQHFSLNGQEFASNYDDWYRLGQEKFGMDWSNRVSELQDTQPIWTIPRLLLNLVDKLNLYPLGYYDPYSGTISHFGRPKVEGIIYVEDSNHYRVD